MLHDLANDGGFVALIIIIIIIISLLKPHVRRTCLHNKNITNQTLEREPEKKERDVTEKRRQKPVVQQKTTDIDEQIYYFRFLFRYHATLGRVP